MNDLSKITNDIIIQGLKKGENVKEFEINLFDEEDIKSTFKFHISGGEITITKHSYIEEDADYGVLASKKNNFDQIIIK